MTVETVKLKYKVRSAAPGLNKWMDRQMRPDGWMGQLLGGLWQPSREDGWEKASLRVWFKSLIEVEERW